LLSALQSLLIKSEQTMTDSAAWVELENGDVRHDLPGPPKAGYYWINCVRKWAHAKGLPIEDGSWALELFVRMSPREVLAFLDDSYGDGLESLRARIAELPGDAVCKLFADEF
jgi:hypothetical protein